MADASLNWEWFKVQVRDQNGLDLAQYKAKQLDRRMATMMVRAGRSTPAEFWEWLNEDPIRLRSFLDRVSINVSSLFRNPEKFEQLQKRVLPELLQQNRFLKIWSAGCSYGAEAYSLAILAAELAPDTEHSVLATDIDIGSLQSASNVRFGEDDMIHVSQARREAFFDTIDGKYQPRRVLADMIKFRTHDLLRDHFGTMYDLILCRNVVIYLEDEPKDRLYHRFLSALRTGGYLFVGNTERILNGAEIGYENPTPFFYRRPIGETRQSEVREAA